MKGCWIVLALMLISGGQAALGPPAAPVTSLTRRNSGDIFTSPGTHCDQDVCVGVSSGTAAPSYTPGSPYEPGTCTCRCLDHLPAFRDDLHICVDDIHECPLAPFVSGSTSQQIPFVFLPLKGQIIHPSKEISFAGVQTPICAVSGAQFLTETGWMELRNPKDADVPFRLFRDEGRTFLQWLGDTELRMRMSGRLIMVQMLCKDLATDPSLTDLRSIFTPCVAFRVAGSPLKHTNNVSEVVFSPDAHTTPTTSGLSVSEYVAIGICSVLLGLIYVASVFLYLHLRRRRRSSSIKDAEGRSTPSPSAPQDVEGVIKNNPLLGLRHFPEPEERYSDEESSDEITSDLLQCHEERENQLGNIQVTSAVIHPVNENFSLSLGGLDSNCHQSQMQDNSSIECLPEENVSIVETLECREERPEPVRSIVSATTRRKLYFNPAYFEPHLLLAPPPAAVEFLTKIREVISIAKMKMATKKFSPNLLCIPEEDNAITLEPFDFSHGPSSRRSSIISLKRENIRRKPQCNGCPECEPQDLKALCGKLPEFPNMAACKTCVTSVNETKQQSIRKWLEDVPVLKPAENEVKDEPVSGRRSADLNPKRIRSPTRSLPCDDRYHEEKFHGTRSISPDLNVQSKRPRRPDKSGARKAKAPLPPTKSNPKVVPQHPGQEVTPNISNHYDVIRNVQPKKLPPPDMINEAMEVDKAEVPEITKEIMAAVIHEFEAQCGIEPTPKTDLKPNGVDYEADSLERSKAEAGYSTPTDYAEVSSSQPSPSLSTALPMDEEVTMRNEVINTETGNKTLSKLSVEEHDYETINLKAEMDKRLYQLPELLQKNDGYSLVSEVYVNNGYNYGSSPSSPNGSNCSTLEDKKPKIRYDEPEKPGHLTIEVEDSPENYIRVDDSDSFEADTLDRKPMKLKSATSFKNETMTSIHEYMDSLERPKQIMLRTTGSFKSDQTYAEMPDSFNTGFHKAFGSLREIYEAKSRSYMRSNDNIYSEVSVDGMMSWNQDDFEEGRLLTLEERQKKRQRRSPTETQKQIPPDVIPSPPNDSPIYERPKPPRKVMRNNKGEIAPPIPPKLGSYSKDATSPMSTLSISARSLKSAEGSRSSDEPYKKYQDLHETKNPSILKEFIHSDDVICKNGINNQFILHASTITNNPFMFPNKKIFLPDPGLSGSPRMDKRDKKTKRLITSSHKPEDSGYLSTDSNDSLVKRKILTKEEKESETDESLGDGQSESGGESIETHSVFFNNFRKFPKMAGSIDSGVGSDKVHPDDIIFVNGLTRRDSKDTTVSPSSTMSSTARSARKY